MISSILSKIYTPKTGSFQINAATSPSGTTITHIVIVSQTNENFVSPPAQKIPAFVVQVIAFPTI